MSDESDEGLAARLLIGDRRALAHAITLVESSRPEHQARARGLLRLVLPHTGSALRIGISGAPGVGKSTFIEALGVHLVQQGRRVAVLAVDPSSTISGGSILGDKTRMPQLSVSSRGFVRPSASGGVLGGVTKRTREALLFCEAAGYDVVLIETVGVGQSEVAVAGMTDLFLLLALARAGDELQGLKRGVLELIDMLAITKADEDNVAAAEQARVEFASALALLRHGSPDAVPEVHVVSARDGRGIEAIWLQLTAAADRARSSGAFEQKRAAQRRSWFNDSLDQELRRRFFSRPGVIATLASLEECAFRGEVAPDEAARQLLDYES